MVSLSRTCSTQPWTRALFSSQKLLKILVKAFGDLSSVVSCSDAMSSWFLQNVLILNPGKTEAVIFGTRQRLSTLIKPVGVRVAGSTVTFADVVKLLGVSLDSTLTFNQHVTNVARACTYHTHALRHTRPLLTVDAAKTTANKTSCKRCGHTGIQPASTVDDDYDDCFR